MLLKTKPHTREPGADKFQTQEASCLAIQLACTEAKKCVKSITTT